MSDIFPSPSSSNHLYEVRAADDNSTLLASECIDTVVIVDTDGVRKLGPEDVNMDSLRLHPRLAKTTRQIIESANVQWALGDYDSYGADNG